ncbi:MAG TPA: HepT-like ribonuclease domain-containing protein [Mucilaginibacter sp.]
MDRKVKLYVDIINSINLIEEFIGSINLFEEYDVDQKTKSAIERQLSILGEAIKRIKDIDPNEPIQYRDEIIGFRNILVHGYDIVDDGVVWSILKKYLNPLKEQILGKLETE